MRPIVCLVVVAALLGALAPFALPDPARILVVPAPEGEGPSAMAPPPAPGPDVDGGATLARASAAFTENAGQLDDDRILFHASSHGVDVGFMRGGAVFVLRDPGRVQGVAVRLAFQGADAVAPVGRGELGHSSNFFLGNDPAAWRTGVRAFREVVYEGLYEGIDLVYRSGPEGLKYEVHVAPGADPVVIAMSYEGIDELLLGPDGCLRARTGLGDLEDAPPAAWTEGGGAVSCAYELRGPCSYGFRCGPRDAARPMVIDPLVHYSTFLGGTNGDSTDGIAVDDRGCAYVAGRTGSWDFPVTAGAFQESMASERNSVAFVAKLDSEGAALVYATYLGGSYFDGASSIAVDGLGSAYVAGSTRSEDFPVTPGALQTTFDGGNGDAFVAKLSGAGDDLVYSTYLGGGDLEEFTSIAVDADGFAYIGGITASTDFPTTPGANRTAYAGGLRDGYVAKLGTDGSTLVYSTYMGGTGDDVVSHLALDDEASVYVAGSTMSSDFPVTADACQAEFGGVIDAIVAKLDPSGARLVYATYLGGDQEDEGTALAVGPDGCIYVSGDTYSDDFPVTPGAFQTTIGAHSDCFVAKLTPSGDALAYATYINGNGYDHALDLRAEGEGTVLVCGHTGSDDFVVTPGALEDTFGGAIDAFLARLGTDGSGLVYSTFIGGSGEDRAQALAVDSSGDIYLTGPTGSPGFPVTEGALQHEKSGGEDAFVLKMSLPQCRLTVRTMPPGLKVTVDGLEVMTPCTKSVAPTTGVAVSVPSPQQIGLDARYVFSNWSDGEAQTHAVVMDAPKELVVTFSVEYLVTVGSVPPGLEVIVDGLEGPAPWSGWRAASTSLAVSAPSPQQEVAGTRDAFRGWSDGGAPAHDIVLDGPIALTATFEQQCAVTLETRPPGIPVKADGEWRPTPTVLWWANGSAHELSVSPAYEDLVFAAWSDGGEASRALTVNGPLIVTATFAPAPVTVLLAGPVEAQSVAGRVGMSGNATAAASIWLSVDDGAWTNVTVALGDGSWDCEWDSLGVRNGAHRLALKAVRWGRESPVIARNVTVSNPLSPGDGDGLPVLPIVMALIAVMAVAVVVLLARRRRRSSGQPPEAVGAPSASAGRR